MIKNLQIRSAASYDQQGAILGHLKKINFIYGSNGSGKTTISEVIRNNDEFDKCSIEWYGVPQKVLVYNRNFIRENFRNDSRVKGIFTLGKDSAELLEKIEQKKSSVDKHIQEILKHKEALEQKEQEEIENIEVFREQCWIFKTKYENEFREALKGFLNSKDKFMEKYLYEATKGDRGPVSLEELYKRRDAVFSNQKVYIQPLNLINLTDLFDKEQIFEQKVIGKEDVDIAALITKLNISDWVQQGHEHSRETNSICPFCQQNLPKNFNTKLDEYFNDTYKRQLKELEATSKEYQRFSQSLINNLSELKNQQSLYFDYERVSPRVDLIKSHCNENQLTIEQKRKEPSRSVAIISVQSLIDDINQEIEEANLKINKHNRLIENIKVEQSNLISEVWQFIVEENKVNYEAFKHKESQLQKAVQGIRTGIDKKETFNKSLKKEIVELESKITSSVPSINQINDILQSFGFNNFILADAGKGNYKIVREDGTDAEATLSEGEKTFITFLYFYQLIKGNESQDQITIDRVIVIDDPISSLDSSVLFIVSNLIRKIIEEIRDKQPTNLKQLIILTHNVYFHKEVSFNKGKSNNKIKDETFWIVRKINKQSSLIRYNENPIKTSYELLWRELNFIKHKDLITMQNVMRRILENYFRFFGNVNIDVEVDKFSEADRVLCHSLLSWANDGSHHVNEDLFIESSLDHTERFLNVFKNIFINMGHGSHYEMMMRGYEREASELETGLTPL